MKIYSITWNPRVEDTSDQYGVTPRQFLWDYEKVESDPSTSNEYVESIKEVKDNLNVFDIYYYKKGAMTKIERIFNPIEILYKDF